MGKKSDGKSSGGKKKFYRPGRGARSERGGVTDRQKMFVEAYLRVKDAREAAREAGFKQPDRIGPRLLQFEHYPLVARLVQEKLAERIKLAVLDGAGVLRYIHTVMLFSPVDHFLPGGDGGWLIDMKDFRKLPLEVKQIVEETEFRTVDVGEGRFSSMIWVRFVSKTTAMGLAARHQLPVPGKLTALGEPPSGPPPVQVDWNRLSGARPPGAHDDPVERRLLALEAPKDTKPEGAQ